MNGGDLIAEALVRHGVTTVFTLCGGHISPILVAAKRLNLRVVDVRDEASAVFAADALSRLTGVPGVAVVTAGPGVANTVTAVANARLAESGLVLLGGAPPTMLQGRGALQDIDHHALIRSQVNRAFAARRVRALPGAVAAAFQAAAQPAPGPAFVECPADLLYDESLVRRWYGAGEPSSTRGVGDRLRRWYLRRHLNRVFAPGPTPTVGAGPAAVPALPDGLLIRVAVALQRAARPVLLLGSQVVRAVDLIPRLTDAIGRLGVPAYASGMARGLLPPGHALLFRHRRTAALKEADLVILAGVPFDFRLDYGRQIGRGATVVSVNLTAQGLRRNRRPTIGAVAEPARLLLGLVDRGASASRDVAPWIAALRSREREREREIETLAARPADGINPLALCRSIDRALDDDSVIVADGGDFVGTAAYCITPRRPLSWLDPGPFGTLGVGGGFALGAKVGRPTAEVWLLYGDGAAAFSIAEFDTMVRHGLPAIAVVGNDGSWAQIARGQKEMLGDDVGTVLSRSAYHRVAEGYGGVGLELKDAACVDSTLAEARAIARSGRPVLVNALIGASEFRAGSISL
ncbi:MAG TPA: thiamine pyrophosphate-binding protein [Gemmatimonadales bacterium]|nr:thiamine pyrophosphate-binding protein [Gemmatimonadales bacterium]